MSAFGAFEDGPDTVLDALGVGAGPDGLIAMPAYSLTGPAIDHLAADPLFDPRTTPSRMGAISEGFRLSPGTIRSIHPTHSTAVRGKGAEEIVAGHETAPTPFGEGTPFPRIVERDALQLFFGCGTGAITMYHSFECTRVPPFPLDVFADRRFEARCLDRDGQRDHRRDARPQPGASPRPDRLEPAPTGGVSRRRSSRRADGGPARPRRDHRDPAAGPLRGLRAPRPAQGITIYDAKLPAEPPTEPPQDRVRG